MLGEFTILIGENLYGRYTKVSCGHYVDTYRITSAGHWYKGSRDVRTMPCKIRDDDALRELNAFESNDKANVIEADLDRKTQLCNIDKLSTDELYELGEINARLKEVVFSG